jgi:tRNA(Ile2)-agmatinylcytidine synthase
MATLFSPTRDGRPVPACQLAFDDTDSPDGMCTTYLAALVLYELWDLDLLGLPRLVRLDPNIPWKTRGNAAICLPLGRGAGCRKPCGEFRGRRFSYFEDGEPADPAEVLERASGVLEREARFDCPNTNPGIVATLKRPPTSLYWRTVRGIVPIGDVEDVLGRCGSSWRKYGNGRGIIGATAAISWRPKDRTWEVISYRARERVGSTREIDPDSVVRMDKSTKYTFNNYDFENNHVAIAPGSPCPILFGIRGDSAEELLRARAIIRGEEPEGWLLFLTNQATDDHIVAKRIGDMQPRDSVRVRARVVARPATLPGGHVLVRVSDGAEADAMFYEPSRRFRDVARALVPGDRVTIVGSVREEPRSLNVEKLAVTKLVRDVRKVANPLCRTCGKRMGSMGSGQGFRCKRCGSKAPQGAAEFQEVARKITEGWYEPPVASRRHLHKPLRRMPRTTSTNNKYRPQ